MGKYLDFYKEHIKTGRIEDGLRNHFNNDANYEILDLVTPNEHDMNALAGESLCTTYWASGMHEDIPYNQIHWPFTPLRQTLVLFMAALAGEFDED